MSADSPPSDDTADQPNSGERQAKETTSSGGFINRLNRGHIRLAVLAVALLVAISFAPGVMAQTNNSTAGQSFCSSGLASLINNAFQTLTFAGPLVGGTRALWNMVKASGAGGDKKEYKENFRSSVYWGLGAGMGGIILGIIFGWAPAGFAMCDNLGMFQF